MGAFGTITVLGAARHDRLKTITFSVAGSNSYATGGDTLDLSMTALGKVHGFKARVDGVTLIAQPTAANSKYVPVYVRAAAGAAATGLVKIHDTSAAADAEVSNATDLSGVTFIFKAVGE